MHNVLKIWQQTGMIDGKHFTPAAAHLVDGIAIFCRRAAHQPVEARQKQLLQLRKQRVDIIFCLEWLHSTLVDLLHTDSHSCSPHSSITVNNSNTIVIRHKQKHHSQLYITLQKSNRNIVFSFKLIFYNLRQNVRSVQNQWSFVCWCGSTKWIKTRLLVNQSRTTHKYEYLICNAHMTSFAPVTLTLTQWPW